MSEDRIHSETGAPLPRGVRRPDGWTPVSKGYTPKKVQGGYVPTTATTGAKPPTGGSGAKPPKK